MHQSIREYNHISTFILNILLPVILILTFFWNCVHKLNVIIKYKHLQNHNFHCEVLWGIYGNIVTFQTIISTAIKFYRFLKDSVYGLKFDHCSRKNRLNFTSLRISEMVGYFYRWSSFTALHSFFCHRSHPRISVWMDRHHIRAQEEYFPTTQRQTWPKLQVFARYPRGIYPQQILIFWAVIHLMKGEGEKRKENRKVHMGFRYNEYSFDT